MADHENPNLGQTEKAALDDVDVLVIGAGLAGCSLGFLMRRSGRSVLAVELRDASAKDKLCGGLLTRKALELFGAIYGKDALARLGAVKIDGIDKVLFNRHLLSPVTAMALPRRRLDGFCLDAYLGAGGMLADRMSLRSIDEQGHVARFVNLCTREERCIHYGVLVGADGACSKVRRLVTGHMGPICVSAEGRVPVREGHVVVAYQPGYSGLYWYIPNGDDANVGCLFHGLSAGECCEMLRDFCAAEGHRLDKLRCAPIPTGEDVLLAAGEDIWLAGDAAGLASKYDGSGMHFALASAHALSAALCGGESFEDAMAPYLRGLACTAETADKSYFAAALRIALSGSIRCQE